MGSTRGPRWERVRDPLYALLGVGIITPQVVTGEWNAIACGVALSLLGLPGAIAVNEWFTRPRSGSGSTPPSSDTSPSPGSPSPSPGRQGGDRRDASA